MPRLHQDTLFPQVLYFAGQSEKTDALEAAANEAGALLDVWHFDPAPEQPAYLGADNSEAARAQRVVGAIRWESADFVAISDRLPTERIQSVAEGAAHLKKAAALLISQEAEVDWVAHGRFSLLRTTTASMFGELIRAYIERSAGHS